LQDDPVFVGSPVRAVRVIPVPVGVAIASPLSSVAPRTTIRSPAAFQSRSAVVSTVAALSVQVEEA
jgi:hypothetical protein